MRIRILMNITNIRRKKIYEKMKIILLQNKRKGRRLMKRILMYDTKFKIKYYIVINDLDGSGTEIG